MLFIQDNVCFFALVKDAYIDDARFTDNFAEATFSKADLARYVLIELNRNMESDAAVGVDEDKASLEHILPKNPGKEWNGALPQDGEPEAWAEAIGNLTLLEKGVNRGLGNKDFNTKKGKGYSKSKLPINEPIAGKDEWTWKEIDERSKALANVAKGVWSLPY